MTASTALNLSRPAASFRNPLGRYMPQSFNIRARWKFAQARRAEYLRRVGGDPDDRQVLIISSMIEAEWSALQSEAQAKEEIGRLRLASLRIAAEHRRQIILLDRD